MRVAFSFLSFSSKVPIAITLCYWSVYLTIAVLNAVLGQEMRKEVKRNDLGRESIERLSSKISSARYVYAKCGLRGSSVILNSTYDKYASSNVIGNVALHSVLRCKGRARLPRS